MELGVIVNDVGSEVGASSRMGSGLLRLYTSKVMLISKRNCRGTTCVVQYCSQVYRLGLSMIFCCILVMEHWKLLYDVGMLVNELQWRRGM